MFAGDTMNDNKCTNYHELMYLMVENDLSEELQLDLDEHLANCESCQKEYADLVNITSQFDILRSDLKNIENSTDLSAIRERNIEALRRKIQKPRKIRIYPRLLNPIAAALLVFVISISVLLFPKSPTTTNEIKTSSSDTSNTGTAGPSENTIPPSTKSIPPFGIDFVSNDADKKNKNISENSKLMMKFPNSNQGHYIQGSYLAERRSISYAGNTGNVKPGIDEEKNLNPIGFKPSQTKIESASSENLPENHGF